MTKIFGIIALGGIGLLYGTVLGLMYLLSLIYLVVTEIIGTRKFNSRFKKLNQLIFDEFKETIKSFKSIFELV